MPKKWIKMHGYFQQESDSSEKKYHGYCYYEYLSEQILPNDDKDTLNRKSKLKL